MLVAGNGPAAPVIAVVPALCTVQIRDRRCRRGGGRRRHRRARARAERFQRTTSVWGRAVPSGDQVIGENPLDAGVPSGPSSVTLKSNCAYVARSLGRVTACYHLPWAVLPGSAFLGRVTAAC